MRVNTITAPLIPDNVIQYFIIDALFWWYIGMSTSFSRPVAVITYSDSCTHIHTLCCKSINLMEDWDQWHHHLLDR